MAKKPLPLVVPWLKQLRDADISSRAKLAGHTIATYADRGGRAYPGYARIAQGMGLSPTSKKTIQKAVRELESAGLITIERPSRRSSFVYLLTPSAASATTTQTAEYGLGDHHSVVVDEPASGGSDDPECGLPDPPKVLEDSKEGFTPQRQEKQPPRDQPEKPTLWRLDFKTKDGFDGRVSTFGLMADANALAIKCAQADCIIVGLAEEPAVLEVAA
jgi:hypothetical protein